MGNHTKVVKLVMVMPTAIAEKLKHTLGTRRAPHDFTGLTGASASNASS